MSAVSLAPWQRTGAEALRHRLDERGWALLADPPGFGKTRTALYAAHGYVGHDTEAPDVVVVAPAALREQWLGELEAWGWSATRVISHGILRRRCPLIPSGCTLIVDEAHHFRNPATRGWRTLSRLIAHAARVLLVTATPVHNRVEDATALLGLCDPGGDAETPLDRLRRQSVRRSVAGLRRRWPGEARAFGGPLVEIRRHRLPAGADEAASGALATLVPLLARALDGPERLVERVVLTRAASSPWAVIATLGRLERFVARRRTAAQEGRHLSPTDWRRLFAAEHSAGAPVQEWLPGLLPGHAVDRGAVHGEGGLARIAAACTVAMRELRRVRATWAARGTLPDEAAVRWLTSTVRSGRPVVVFTEFVDTARGLWRSPPGRLRVAYLSAGSGALPGMRSPVRARTVRDALRRWACAVPGAVALERPAAVPVADSGCRQHPLLLDGSSGAAVDPARPADGPSASADSVPVDVFVLTAAWSEGIDLPGVDAVLHWDLPATPARMEQRVGRVQRGVGPTHIEEVWRVPSGELGRRLRSIERLARKEASAATLSRAAEEATERPLSPSSVEHAQALRPCAGARAVRWAADGMRRALVAGSQDEARLWMAVLEDVRRPLTAGAALRRERVLDVIPVREFAGSGPRVRTALRVLSLLDARGGPRGIANGSGFGDSVEPCGGNLGYGRSDGRARDAAVGMGGDGDGHDGLRTVWSSVDGRGRGAGPA
ncbi:MAG: hypothetical protein EA398_04140 [Deltaproteobacteria bacterium]|nr:MAG: hypothetical protein EA398_04140 [Deltaproteobacteria bacterium]